MESSTIFAIAIGVLVALGVLVLFTNGRRRDVHSVSRETAKQDRSDSPFLGGENEVLSGRDVERAAVLERRGGGTALVPVQSAPPAPWGPPDRLRAFCERVGKRAVVLVDEAYREYATSPAFDSMSPLVAAGANVVVLHTFSKLYGLAGLRVGYAVARPDLAKALSAARMGNAETCLNAAGVAAALASLDDAAWLATCRADTARGRAELTAFLKAQDLAPAASDASFVFVPMPGDLDAFGKALESRNVKIVSRTRIGGCRITVGLPEEMAHFRIAFTEARKEIA
jgi:histidinol-phosphate/aromatic aminotransferase/cobyric acid decarboxylase-like protein